jgi:hypothetical protein
MHSAFKLDKTDIQQLDDKQARELIAKLCKEEMRKNGQSSAFVIWGGDQRAKDGGVDVRVKIDHPVNLVGYIPRGNTIFQVKAVQAFKAANIKKEMTPAIKGAKPPSEELLSCISELAQCSGAYIIASTKSDVSDSALRTLKTAMESCISSAGLTGQIHLDFYDSQKIADWAEQHPAIVIWIKSILGNPVVGWKPYAAWAYREQDVNAEYLLDDQVKIIGPSVPEEITVSEAIKQIRRDLSHEKASVRIVGLSGLGKTPLVQALFDIRIVPEVDALNQNNLIYTDISDNPSPQPNALIESLQIDKADTVVIVDNCGTETHNKLTELVQKTNSKIRLLTVEYDIQDGLLEDTQCYRLDASSDNLIKQLLERRYPDLSPVDIDKIAEFSGGNARVAFALAESSEKKGQLSKLEDKELFLRLFMQRNRNDDNLLRSAEVCSLLYSFDTEDSSADSELALLAALAEVTILTLNRHILELQRRGLVQQRGKWKAMLPHAISNRLAAKALEDYPNDLLQDNLVSEKTPRVVKSFSHRLGFLHESQEARNIVAGWLNPGGICADLANLNDAKQRIFSYIAPVNQSVTLDALMRASQSSEFFSVKNFKRRDFIHIARSLAYEERYFDQAVAILLLFALVEPSDSNNSPALNDLKSLFNCYLSGTLALPLQRASFVRQLIQNSDQAHVKIGIALMTAALKTGHFSSHHNFDFGAHSRRFGWEPKTTDGLIEWYSAFIAIAFEVGAEKYALGVQVRKSFADNFRGLWAWTGADLSRQLSHVAEIFHGIDGWAEGWLAIKSILQYDKDKVSSDSLLELRRLEALLAPKNLSEKIHAQVFSSNAVYGDDDNEDDDDSNSNLGKYQKREKRIEQLGRLAGEDMAFMIELLPVLLRTSSYESIPSFAHGAAHSCKDIQILLEAAKEIIQDADLSSLDFLFVIELIRGWNKIDTSAVASFLALAVDDPIWGQIFPWLQLSTPLNDDGYARLLSTIELGLAPIWRFRCLQNGSVTATLSVDQVINLISAIAKKTDGVSVAIEILHMVVYGAKERNDVYRQDLADHCICLLKTLNWQELNDRNEILNHHLCEVLTFALRSQMADANIELILQNMFEFNITGGSRYSSRSKTFFKPFFLHHAKKTLDIIYRVDEDGSYRSSLNLMSDPYSSLHQASFFQPPVDLVLEWCEVSPEDRLLFIAQICPVFRFDQSESNSENGLSEYAKAIFKIAQQKAPILNAFVTRFAPTTYSGSLATIIRSRIPMLDELNLEQDPSIAQMIEEAKEKLNMKADSEAAWDEERNQTRNVSFE